MLDAYIIERIRQEQEQERQRKSNRLPLHIDHSPPTLGDSVPPPEPSSIPDDETGEVIVDYQLA